MNVKLYYDGDSFSVVSRDHDICIPTGDRHMKFAARLNEEYGFELANKDNTVVLGITPFDSEARNIDFTLECKETIYVVVAFKPYDGSRIGAPGFISREFGPGVHTFCCVPQA